MLKAAALSMLLVAGMAVPAFAQANLAGTYTYTGTDPDGSTYDPGELVVKSVPSGAFEITWDGGQYVGVGQVTGSVFAVASVAEGKNSIMLFTINPDGSLAGKWWRRTDAGTKGTEVWKKK